MLTTDESLGDRPFVRLLLDIVLDSSHVGPSVKLDDFHRDVWEFAPEELFGFRAVWAIALGEDDYFVIVDGILYEIFGRTHGSVRLLER